MANGVSIFARGRILWAKITSGGIRRNVSTKLPVGQEAKARTWAIGVKRQLDAEHRAAGGKGPLTVDAYAATWLEARKATVDDWKNDAQRLRSHILPTIGRLHLADVQPPDLVALFADLRASGNLAPRTLYNVYSVVSAMFRDARMAGLIVQSPAILTVRELGPKVDKDPTVRGEAVFEREEVGALVSDPRIPFDRRVAYALGALAGLRHGEIAGLRWRHLDLTRTPLGALTIATSYDKGRTKTGVTRRIPVHPLLADIVRAWAGHGWPAIFGRVPGPHDLVVPLEPDPPGKRARLNPRAGGVRSKNDSRKRWLVDLATLGVRHRRGHDLRATFITLAVEDGADLGTIEKLTHTPPNRKAIDGYWRTQWPSYCREVAKLTITLVDDPTAMGTSWVQSPESSTNPQGKEWRRRESNAGATLDGDARRAECRQVGHLRVLPGGADDRAAVPKWVQSAPCDVGLLALTASGRAARLERRRSVACAVDSRQPGSRR